MPSDALPPGPIFIGGTGRSGTWVLGRMIEAHPRLVTLHTELRFHASPPGFAAVLEGRLSPEQYAKRVSERWFRIAGGDGKPKGLQLVVRRFELERALERFVEAARDDVPSALGALMLEVVAPFARGRDALGWAETTPDNAASAHALTTALPTARVIHSVRDGRDVAASVATMPWGPATAMEGLDWWADRLRKAHAGLAAADPARVHTVRLEELIHGDRDREIERLLAAMGVADGGPLRAYFDDAMTGESSSLGRWRRDLPTEQRDALDARYRTLLAELAADGVDCLPTDPDVVDGLAAPAAGRPGHAQG